MLISAVQQSDSVICTYSLFHILFHYSLSQDTEYSSLCYTVGTCCLSTLYITKPFICIHLFNLHNNLLCRHCYYAHFLCSSIPVPRATSSGTFTTEKGEGSSTVKQHEDHISWGRRVLLVSGACSLSKRGCSCWPGHQTCILGFFFQFYWNIIDIRHCISLRCAA